MLPFIVVSVAVVVVVVVVVVIVVVIIVVVHIVVPSRTLTGSFHSFNNRLTVHIRSML